jgi:hypothetical protein
MPLLVKENVSHAEFHALVTSATTTSITAPRSETEATASILAGRKKSVAAILAAVAIVVILAAASGPKKGPFGRFFSTPECGGGCDEPASYDW